MIFIITFTNSCYSFLQTTNFHILLYIIFCIITDNYAILKGVHKRY